MSLTLGLIFFFLGTALLLYVLLGGADFGAGILELFLGNTYRKEQRELISHAMAPVWEANHVWLILVIVILFMGFPTVYTQMSTYLHLPLLAILLGIVARGCAFTFRHYDIVSENYYLAYSHVFAFSSLWTAFFLGTLAGALTLGHINPQATTFFELYLAPWVNVFSFSLGLFTCCFFAFLSAIYLIGEAKSGGLRNKFVKKAKVANVVLIISGALVFISAELQGLPLISLFFKDPISLAAFIIATILVAPFWLGFAKGWSQTIVRILGAAIVSLVLFGWYAVQFPWAMRTKDGGLSFYEAAAPAPTQRALLIALIVGILIIFPSIGYLLKVFKWETFRKER